MFAKIIIKTGIFCLIVKYPGTNTYNTIKANDGSQNQLHFEIIKIFF